MVLMSWTAAVVTIVIIIIIIIYEIHIRCRHPTVPASNVFDAAEATTGVHPDTTDRPSVRLHRILRTQCGIRSS
jgi:hypothetical protein